MIRRPPRSTLFPTRRSSDLAIRDRDISAEVLGIPLLTACGGSDSPDRKSTRLNSSHQIISYAVFCLKKKKNARKNNYESTDMLSAWQPYNIQDNCMCQVRVV